MLSGRTPHTQVECCANPRVIELNAASGKLLFIALVLCRLVQSDSIDSAPTYGYLIWMNSLMSTAWTDEISRPVMKMDLPESGH